MTEQCSNDLWQVEVNGQVYEAAFGELGEWIAGGSLLPGDKVRKGKLRWIEARKVPSLVPFFNAKENGLPMPVVVTTTDAAISGEVAGSDSSPLTANVSDHAAHMNAPNPDACAVHPDLQSDFICDGCANGFCSACPNRYGGTVKVCPLCGAMCRAVNEVQSARQFAAKNSAAIATGFGLADFFAAIAHPFKFKVSLFVGALMFAFFSLGQSAASIGGIFMVVSALICLMLANMLTFGVLTNTVDNFSQGNLGENFMPNFDDFSLWEDVVHPFFLSIGVYVSSFGPFLLVMMVGLYLIVNAVSSQMNTFQSEIEKIPGTQVYSGRQLVEQSDEVRKVLDGLKKENAERLTRQAEMADGGPESIVGQPEKEQEEMLAVLAEGRKAQFESVIGKTPETKEKEAAEMLMGFLSLAAPLVVIGFITLLWGLLYFPAACVVAGYTKSFLATLNPLVGLDTARRLGFTYVKILFMGFLLAVVWITIGGILSLIFSPFNLPGIGNLPAKWFASMFGFYVSVVFSCIIGYALFKSADKLQLQK